MIFAGQGKKDHLRAAIQMLSGAVPRRRTVYGHLGWRRIGDHWAYLHSGGAIRAGGALDGIGSTPAATVSARTSCLHQGSRACRSRARLARSSESWTRHDHRALLGAVYRAPLGEPSPVDFSVHLTGPTGVFKSELAAVAQAPLRRRLQQPTPARIVGRPANMLEKAFLAKDAVLVIDDFAPAGTTADVQRLHREADRLFRGAGNRSGRARMRADGGSRPTYTRAA